jgi:putative flippase GtrA
LYATAAAIELTLLHNFVWHLHYTWRDRRDGSALLAIRALSSFQWAGFHAGESRADAHPGP